MNNPIKKASALLFFAALTVLFAAPSFAQSSNPDELAPPAFSAFSPFMSISAVSLDSADDLTVGPLPDCGPCGCPFAMEQTLDLRMTLAFEEVCCYDGFVIECPPGGPAPPPVPDCALTPPYCQALSAEAGSK